MLRACWHFEGGTCRDRLADDLLPSRPRRRLQLLSLGLMHHDEESKSQKRGKKEESMISMVMEHRDTEPLRYDRATYG